MTNYRERSPYREVVSLSAIQEYPKHFMEPEVHYRVHNSRPLVPILNQMIPVHALPSHLLFSFHLLVHLGLHGALFHHGSHQNPTYISLLPMRATYPPISSSLV
jgi:hypothetical protein